MPRPAHLIFAAALGLCFAAAAQTRYAAVGIVIAADAPGRLLTISHEPIPGYMEAMTMPFRVRGGAEFPAALKRGDRISFTLFVNRTDSWIGDIRVQPFDSGARDPAAVRRLQVLDAATGRRASPLPNGAPVPPFSLTDQQNRPVTLTSLRGKVIALNFVYTRCPLPDYCFRLTNSFAQLQKRFSTEPTVVFLTVTFDPAHDTPAAMAKYADIWHSHSDNWRFLTGPSEEVERLCAEFGVEKWQDEGLYTHTLHTAVIDARGRLAANIEGNRFTVKQLGDLIDSVMRESRTTR